MVHNSGRRGREKCNKQVTELESCSVDCASKDSDNPYAILLLCLAVGCLNMALPTPKSFRDIYSSLTVETFERETKRKKVST